MDDHELDRFLDRAAKRWRIDDAPPLDAIWQGVLAESAGVTASRVRRRPSWTGVGIAAAAALTVGLLGGRAWARHDAARALSPVSVTTHPGVTATAPDPDQQAMGELLLPHNSAARKPSRRQRKQRDRSAPDA